MNISIYIYVFLYFFCVCIYLTGYVLFFYRDTEVVITIFRFRHLLYLNILLNFMLFIYFKFNLVVTDNIIISIIKV